MVFVFVVIFVNIVPAVYKSVSVCS